jgi:hypothetical protein
MRNFMKTFSTPLLQSVILNMHPMLASPPFKLCTNRGKANSEFEFHLNGIAREYQRKSHLKEIPIRDLGNIYTQPICYACGETCHVARLCPNKKVSSLDHLKKKACSCCGEEGHQASQCPGNCPNYEDNHPFGECLTRVNSTNVLDEGLRIGEIGRRMNSKVKLVEIGMCRK